MVRNSVVIKKENKLKNGYTINNDWMHNQGCRS